jgi:hypothetical protein
MNEKELFTAHGRFTDAVVNPSNHCAFVFSTCTGLANHLAETYGEDSEVVDVVATATTSLLVAWGIVNGHLPADIDAVSSDDLKPLAIKALDNASDLIQMLYGPEPEGVFEG